MGGRINVAWLFLNYMQPLPFQKLGEINGKNEKSNVPMVQKELDPNLHLQFGFPHEYEHFDASKVSKFENSRFFYRHINRQKSHGPHTFTSDNLTPDYSP